MAYGIWHMAYGCVYGVWRMAYGIATVQASGSLGTYAIAYMHVHRPRRAGTGVYGP
jgi:hypothetical protein